MKFESARLVEQLVWQMRLAEWGRSQNRALLNSLSNGAPPYTLDEEQAKRHIVNVNDLSMTRLCHEARLQMYQAFNKPGNFFTARTDMGTPTKRAKYGADVTSLINKRIKKSDKYFECDRAEIAQTVLHGIGPSNWEDQDHWCPIEIGIEDVLVPDGTLLNFRNLPFFAVARQYTAQELTVLTSHPEHNPGWNMPVVEQALKWVDEQAKSLYSGGPWTEYWSPEKTQERIKSNSGIYASDLVPTIDTFDFYYWDDAGDHEGWRRRIIFDAYGGYAGWNGPSGYGAKKTSPSKNLLNEEGQYLYDSGDRVVADDIHQIMHFQFADLSTVAPFRYHSVRSLGFLLYAACHLQNRLRCGFAKAVFEALMMYMRVNSADEFERALKVEMIDQGFIDNSVQFIPPDQRYQVNEKLVALGLAEYKQVIDDNSSSFVQNRNMSQDRVEKTKFQVMAEVNAAQTLVSAGLQLSYRYKTSKYREIFRRFMNKSSTDVEVKQFRAECLKRGVPDKILVPEAWDIEPERILGGGNKTMEMAIAQQLMEWRPAFPPESQQKILHKATLSITDDAAEASDLVPLKEGVNDTKHDAMVAFGSLMAGGKVAFTDEQNRIEVAQVLIGELGMAVQQAMKMGGTVSPDRLVGMQNVLDHISQAVAEIAQDPQQKEVAKGLAQQSGKLANMVKAFGQRLKQQMEAQAKNNGDNGKMAETQAKVAGTVIMARAKAELGKESHAQKTAQRQVTWEQQQRQKEQEHQLQMRREVERQQVEDKALDLTTAATVRRQKYKAFDE